MVRLAVCLGHLTVFAGLVGRNGVGKTTLLRAIAAGEIELPEYLNIVHVEQEITGDDRSALQTVLDADKVG